MGELLLRVAFGFALGNDFFNPLSVSGLSGRCFDDDGFTNDLSAWLTVCKGHNCFSLDARHRMLTERNGMRRTDILEVRTRAVHALALDEATLLVFESATALAMSGAFGGERLQDAMHSVTNGRRLNSGRGRRLQNITPGQVRVGLVLAWAATISRAIVPWLRIGNTTGVALALGGTGLTAVHSTLFAQIYVPFARVLSFDVGASVSVNRQVTNDPSLILSGGYNVDEAFITTELSVGFSIRPIRAGFNLRTNEGGAGANMGVFTLGVFL